MIQIKWFFVWSGLSGYAWKGLINLDVVADDFFSTCQTKKVVSKYTISFWLHEVIKKVYQSSEQDDTLHQYWAHEVRGIAPTLLFRRNFTVGWVLKAWVLSSQITFAALYLGLGSCIAHWVL